MNTLTRWVHSEAQLADALTKRLTASALKRVLSLNIWTLVEDPSGSNVVISEFWLLALGREGI